MATNDQRAKPRKVSPSAIVQQQEPKISAILNAAERIFGTNGYAGASMRLIAEEAGVAQALLHYHYGTKENLYTAVFERRSLAINNYRSRLLDELLQQDSLPTIEDVLTIAFTPLTVIFEGQDTDNLPYYVQMVATVSLGSDTRSKRIREQFYDPMAARFIDALHKVLPNITHDNAVYAYLFSIGARQQAHALNDRATFLGASPRSAKSTAHYSQLVRFAAAGIRALLESQSQAVKSGARKTRTVSEPVTN